VTRPTHQGINHALLAFYQGEQGDVRGRTIAQILAWNDLELEVHHDYIQWLFPLDQPSAFNPGAPLLNPATIAAMREDAAVQQNLAAAFRRMAAFYGFSVKDNPVRVERAPDAQHRFAEWLTPGNHNHLRISRILRSITLLGQEPLARCFLAALLQLAKKHPDQISTTTLKYWQQSVEQ